MPITFQEDQVDTVDRSVYTFTAMGLGTATRHRSIIVGIVPTDNAAITVTSVTVAGVAASRIAQRNINDGGNHSHTGLYYADIGPTGGTSGDVVVTLTTTMQACSCATWDISEGALLPELDSGSHSVTPNLQVILRTEPDNYVVGLCAGQATSPSVAWTNLTEDFDTASGSLLMSGASATATANEARTVDADISGSGPTNESLVVVTLIAKALELGTLVHQTSVTTGTGNQTLVAVNGKQDFSDVFGVGGADDLFHYFISNPDAAEWEIGTGHLSSATVLVRDTVNQSSNGDAAVSFTAGTKDITNDLPALEQGGAWDLLETVVAVAESTVDVINLSSKHFLYQFVWTDLQPNTALEFLEILTDANNGASFDAGSTDYAWTNHSIEMVLTTPATALNGDDSDNSMVIHGAMSNGADELSSLDVILFNPSATEFTKLIWTANITNTTPVRHSVIGGGIRLSAALVDAIRFQFQDSDTIDGTLKIWGLRA